MPPFWWHFVLNMFYAYDLQRVAIVNRLSMRKSLSIVDCQFLLPGHNLRFRLLYKDGLL